MARTLLAALSFLAGCDPYWGYGVRVKSPTGAAVSGAPVTMECRNAIAVDPSKTDGEGVAHLGGVGSTHPPACSVKVEKEGFVTQSFSVADTCSGDVRKCPRNYVHDVVLQPASAPAP
jgi:hypothetical protein